MISQQFQDEVWNKLNSIERRLSLAGGGGSYAPSDAQYLTLSLSALLPNERVLVAGVGLDLVDGGAGGNATLNVDVGIADNDILSVDLAGGLIATEIVRATAAGLESRTDAQILAQLSASAGATFDWNAQNLTNIGTLSAGPATIGSVNSEAHLIFRRGGYNYVTTPLGGSLAFVPNGAAVGVANFALVIASDKTISIGPALPVAGVALQIYNAADAFCRTRLYGSQIALRKVTFAGGSWARNLLQFEEHDGTIYTMVGAKGTDNTFQYGFIGEAFNDVALAWDASENVGIGVYAWGTNAEQVLAVGTGVAPTTSPANAFQMYSADIAPGNAAPHFRTEDGTVIKLDQAIDTGASPSFVNLTATGWCNIFGILGLGGGMPATTARARAYLNVAQDNIANGAWTPVDLDTESYDPGADFDVTTHRYTTPRAGYYSIHGQASLSSLIGDKQYGVRIYNVTDAKTEAYQLITIGNLTDENRLGCSDIVYLGDARVIELQVYQNSGGALVDIGADDNTSLSIHLISV